MAFGLQMMQRPVGTPVTLAEAKLAARVDADITADDPLIYGLIQAAVTYIEARLARALVSRTYLATWDRFPRYSQLGGLQYQSEGLWDQRIPVTEMSARYWPDRAVLRVPQPPTQQVLSITYTDLANTLQTLPVALYRVDYSTEWARIGPSFGNIWPLIVQQMQAVSVQFVSGFGPATTIAANIAAGTQTVTPASMYGIYPQSLADPIYPGTALAIDTGTSREIVTVTATTGTTFTATFGLAHTGPVQVMPAIPETVRQALMLLVNHWYRNREAVTPGSMTELPLAVDALLTSAWSGELT
jgi:hypothetical protein